jgi:hypothetical protein
MSKNILFISEMTLKNVSMLSGNIDPKLLLPTVKLVQDKYILPLLGSGLYNYLQTQVENNTVDGAYKTLLDDYISDTQVWYTLSEMPYPLRYKMINKGVVTREGEAIQTVSTTDIEKLMDYCKNNAEYYAERAIRYLRTQQTDFPEYTSPGSGYDTIHPDHTQYAGGIFLGGMGSGNCEYYSKYGGGTSPQ